MSILHRQEGTELENISLSSDLIHPDFLKKGLEFIVGKEVQTLEAFLDFTFSGYTSGNDS